MRRQGFTLVELLLALLVFALLSSGLYGVLHGALRFDLSARRLHASSRDIRLGIDMLAREIENAFAYPQVVDGRTVAFEGERGRIMFYLAQPDGLRRVEYFSGDLARTMTTEVRHLSNVRELARDSVKETKSLYLLRSSQALPDFWRRVPGSVEVMGVAAGLAGPGAEFSFGEIDVQGRVAFRDEWKADHLPDVVRIRCSLFAQPQTRVTVDVFPVVRTLAAQGDM
jgi:prepilin-type N-terminal cleavage/methylation domain-containing protein